MDIANIPPTATLYLRPTEFADTPVGRDGEVARLAGGLIWFAAYELIAVEGGSRVVQASIPVAAFDRVTGTLTSEQAARARLLVERISAPRSAQKLGERTLRFDQPQVMAILDLFEGGDPDEAARTGFDMGASGAALVDIGGESTRPSAATLWENDEIARVVPAIAALAATGAPVSVATRKAAVMEAALVAGATMVSDVAALLWDQRAAAVVATASCPVVLMHSPNPVKGPHADGSYGDVLTDVFDWLEARVAAVVAAGVDRRLILIDPGIGLGKSLADNLALLNGLAMLHGIGCPIVLGASRDRMIGALANEAPVDERLGGSLALALHGTAQGAQLLRVHDVAETVQALKVWRGLKDAALTSRRD